MTTSTTRILKRAPLPFQGQKSKWFAQYSEFLDRIEQKAHELNRPVCVIDVFGGSGLLSHWTKRLHPAFTVVYNDFDNYTERIKHIHDVNLLLAELRKLFPEYVNDKLKRNEQIPHDKGVQLRQLINNFKGVIDPYTLSSWFKYSGTSLSTVDEFLKDERFYFRLPITDYNEDCVNHYLDGITVIHEDASDYNKFQHIIKPLIPSNALTFYILDPPYLYCDKGGYKSSYFKLESTIDLINYFIHEDYFIFFNSTKSGFDEFLHKINEIIPTVRLEYEHIDKYSSLSKNATNNEYALIRIT